jgi:hemerythrin
MLKEWSDEYLIGIEELDEQHKGFFEAAHKLYDQILNCEGDKSIGEVVDYLRSYASRHFRTEEAFMRKHNYPRLEEHQQLHIAFFESLDQLVEDFKVFGPTQHLADQALEIAQDWLIDHIADEDVLYASHAKN